MVNVSQCHFPHYKEGNKEQIGHTVLMSYLRQGKPHSNILLQQKMEKLPVSVHTYRHTIGKHDEKYCFVSHACI